MDVDASMSTESDHDLAAANHHEDTSASSASSQVTETVPPQGPRQPPQQQPATASGPRPAPTYSVVNAIIEKKEDGPGCRCGHTLTAVAAVGEEGTSGYIGPRLILFDAMISYKLNDEKEEQHGSFHAMI